MPDFDPEPNGSVGATCISFNTIDPNTKANTKFRSSQLPILKDEVTARKTFINTVRIVELPLFLGNIDQNTNDGTINSKSGVYGERFTTINVRLNLILGDNLASLNSLSKQNNSIEGGKESTQDKFDVYTLLLAPTSIEAPTSNTEYIQTKDASIFSNGDTVYIISNSQPETSYTVDSIEVNRIKMTSKVPQKYRPEEGAHIYKEL